MVDGLPFHPDDDGVLKRMAGWMTGKAMREIGTMMTGGSSSIKDLWLPMREAGASARAMLVGAAASQWNVPAAECRAETGKVLHASGRSASFGELAALAAKQPLPEKISLKDPASFKLIGQPLRRIEAAAKFDGTARFGIDVRPEGLRYASVLMCPTLGGTVARFDAAAALKLPGVVKAFAVGAHNGGSGGVAAIADTTWQAMRALKEIKVEWNHGAGAGVSSEDVNRRLSRTLDGADGHAYYSHGDVDAALKSAAKTVVAEYRAPYLAHAAMEPANCTVQFKDGAATVWASTQMPALARDQVAKVLGIAPARWTCACSFSAAVSDAGSKWTSFRRRRPSRAKAKAGRCRRSGRASRTCARFLSPGLRFAFQGRTRCRGKSGRLAQQFGRPVDRPAGIAAQLRPSRRGPGQNDVGRGLRPAL